MSCLKVRLLLYVLSRCPVLSQKQCNETQNQPCLAPRAVFVSLWWLCSTRPHNHDRDQSAHLQLVLLDTIEAPIACYKDHCITEVTLKAVSHSRIHGNAGC